MTASSSSSSSISWVTSSMRLVCHTLPHAQQCAPLALQADFVLENWSLVEKARVIYCTGFFITVSPEAIAAVSSHTVANDKIYCMVCGHSGGAVGNRVFCEMCL